MTISLGLHVNFPDGMTALLQYYPPADGTVTGYSIFAPASELGREPITLQVLNPDEQVKTVNLLQRELDGRDKSTDVLFHFQDTNSRVAIKLDSGLSTISFSYGTVPDLEFATIPLTVLFMIDQNVYSVQKAIYEETPRTRTQIENCGAPESSRKRGRESEDVPGDTEREHNGAEL